MKGSKNNKVTDGVSDKVDALVGISVISRLEAAERHYRPRCAFFAAGLKHAIEIAQEDGWQHIAPAWIKTNA